MKYRIIEERDLNGEGHFELELWQKGLFGYKWKPVTRAIDCGYDVGYSPKYFSTKEQCMKYIKETIKNRVVIEEGEVK